MKLQTILQSMISALKKYKHALLVVFLGMILLLLPTGKNGKEDVVTEETVEHELLSSYGQQVEERLEAVLSQIDGVGQVHVILTIKQSGTNHYLYDSTVSKEQDGDRISESEERNTVLFSHGSSYDEATITTVDYPLFQGALIVCEGGGKPEIQLLLTQAVSALTNLRSDKITVVKMK